MSGANQITRPYKNRLNTSYRNVICSKLRQVPRSAVHSCATLKQAVKMVLLSLILVLASASCISAQYCSGWYSSNCDQGKICCNHQCVYGSNCIGRSCYTQDECSSYESCCSGTCWGSSDCSGHSCSFDSDCSTNQYCCSGFCSWDDCESVLAVILGSVFGVLFLIGIIVAVIIICCRRRRRGLAGGYVVRNQPQRPRVIATSTTTNYRQVPSYPPLQPGQPYYQPGYPQHAGYGAVDRRTGQQPPVTNFAPPPPSFAAPPPYQAVASGQTTGGGNNDKTNRAEPSAPPVM